MSKFNEYIYDVLAFIDSIKSDKFNYGILVGSIVTLLVILLYLLFKVRFSSRKKRINQLIINDCAGDLIITADTIEQNIKEELNLIDSLEIKSVTLYKQSKKYSLSISCINKGDKNSLKSLHHNVQDLVFKMFKDFFGISNLKKIDLKFQEISYEEFKKNQVKDIIIEEESNEIE